MIQTLWLNAKLKLHKSKQSFYNGVKRRLADQNEPVDAYVLSLSLWSLYSLDKLPKKYLNTFTELVKKLADSLDEMQISMICLTFSKV